MNMNKDTALTIGVFAGIYFAWQLYLLNQNLAIVNANVQKYQPILDKLNS